MNDKIDFQKQKFWKEITKSHKEAFCFIYLFYFNAPRLIVNIFKGFNWEIEEESVAVLNEGIAKHIRCIYNARLFSFSQLSLCIFAPEMGILLTVMSFFYLQNGSSWFGISFQNIANKQLDAGVATTITEKMYRVYLIALTIMIIGACVLIVRISIFVLLYGPIDSLIPSLLPNLLPNYIESIQPEITILNIIIAISILANIIWLFLIFSDSHHGSVMYDGMDSMLGNALPEILDGAKANTSFLPILEELKNFQIN